MAHLEQFATTVSMFLRALARLAVERAAAQYEPQLLVEAVVPLEKLVADMDLGAEPPLTLLRQLFGSEPSTWHGAVYEEGGVWLVRASSFDAASGVSTVLRIMSPGCARG